MLKTSEIEGEIFVEISRPLLAHSLIFEGRPKNVKPPEFAFVNAPLAVGSEGEVPRTFSRSFLYIYIKNTLTSY